MNNGQYIKKEVKDFACNLFNILISNTFIQFYSYFYKFLEKLHVF